MTDKANDESQPITLSQWCDTLNDVEEWDMRDALQLAEPTATNVTARFRSLFGNHPRLPTLVEEAIENFEPFTTLEKRVATPTAIHPTYSAADQRGVRSFYNAAVAARCR